jgi:hypothetical protein
MEKKNAAPLLRLVPKKSAEVKPCASTIETATYLLQEAIAGRLKGLAYGAILADKHYYVETTGAADTDPLFALGVIEILRDQMCERHRE